MLIEFVRHQEANRAEDVMGEDDGLEQAGPRPDRHLTVDPRYVSAVIEGQALATGEPSPVTVIRLSDGRGFLVKGTYRETLDKLQASGGAVPENGSRH